jgi:hypothetical protein
MELPESLNLHAVDDVASKSDIILWTTYLLYMLLVSVCLAHADWLPPVCIRYGEL